MYILYPAYKGPIDLIPGPILDYPDDTAAAIVLLVQLLVATAVALIYGGAPESPTS